MKRASGGAQLVGAVVGHRAVQARDHVQVHEAAALVFGDLDVGDADLLAQPLLRHAGVARERARDVDRAGAAPQLAERVVPDDRARVVEAVQAQRLTEARIVLVVHAGRTRAARRARRRARRGAGGSVAAGRPGRAARVCTSPKLGAVSVKNTAGCSVTVSGTPLPPLRPAAISW